MSLAVHRDLVCVAHAGSRAGVSCARWTPRGIDPFDALRSLDLNQTNPPSTSRNLLSETYFAHDGQGPVLVAHVRGITSTTNNTNTGFLATWAVDQQQKTQTRVSDKATIVSPSGTASLFGAAPIPHSSLVFVADPTFGGVTIDLARPQTPVTKTVVPRQKAICWARLGVNHSTGILPDAGLNRIVQVDLLSGGILQDWTSANGNAGNFDFSLAGDRLYALAFGAGDTTAHVAVFDVSGFPFADVQNVVVNGTDRFSMGLAVYS